MSTSGPILITGGSGRLGRALQSLVPGLVAPPRSELDVTDPASVHKSLKRHAPRWVVHAAAYTDVSRAERERSACWNVNVGGTRNVALACRDGGVPLLHVSTDYVFAGSEGGYAEDDPVGPPLNHYALTKIAAEAVARAAPRHLILRTSFRDGAWPHPVAFDDLVTGQDYLDVLAPEIALVVQHLDAVPFDTLHIVTEPKTALNLARRRRSDIEAASRHSAPVPLPADISLDTARWAALKPTLLGR